jgi:hypothetical protein
MLVRMVILWHGLLIVAAKGGPLDPFVIGAKAWEIEVRFVSCAAAWPVLRVVCCVLLCGVVLRQQGPCAVCCCCFRSAGNRILRPLAR